MKSSSHVFSRKLIFFACIVACATAISSVANGQADERSGAPVIGQANNYQYQFGTIIGAQGRPIENLKVTIAVPQSWPEQVVRLEKEEVTDGVSYKFRELNGVRQIVTNIKRVAANGQIKILLTMNISVAAVSPPTETSDLIKPKKPKKQLREFMGDSPLIEHRVRPVAKLAKELVKDEQNPWNQVKILFDWVHKNIELSGGKPVGSQKALKAKKACVQDRINIFIALCRNQKIPARTVWADNGTEYAEFYLENSAGKGFWYPCVMNGASEFATLKDPVVIEQKGENHKLPEKKKKVRYVRETVDGSSTADPDVKFIRKQISKLAPGELGK